MTHRSSPSAYGHLVVDVHDARSITTPKLTKKFISSYSRLLCVVECADGRHRTRSRRTMSGNATWNERDAIVTFERAVDVDEDFVRISVWDKRGREAHECRGSARIALRDPAIERGLVTVVSLVDGDGGYAGEVKLRARVVGLVEATREPGDARAEESVEAEAVEDEMVVRTEMTPVHSSGEKEEEEGEEEEDVNTEVEGSASEDAEVEDAKEIEEEAEAEAEAEEDEWSAALKPSRAKRNEVGEVTSTDDDGKITNAAVERATARDAMMAEIWGEDSTDDIVMVTPPNSVTKSRFKEDNSSNDEHERALQELHTFRHVASPIKADRARAPEKAIASPTQAVAHAEASEMDVTPNLAPASPERPLKPALKTDTPSENVEVDPVAMVSPNRSNALRVTFDNRVSVTPPMSGSRPNREIKTPPSAQKGLFASRTKYDKENPLSPSNTQSFSMPTKAEIEEARRLAVMHERADAVFASWSW